MDFHSHSEGSSGGFFGGKKSTTIDVTQQATVASVVRSGGSVTVEAGTAGSGDAVLHGSRIRAEGDVALKAEGNVQVTPNQVENYANFQEERSGFMGTQSSAQDEARSVTNDRPEIEAGGKVALGARQDVILQSARITSGDETEITAREGQVAMLVSKDSEYKRTVKTDMGFLTWSSSDKGKVDETVLHTLIDAGKGLTITTPEGVVVEFKESTGDVRKDAALLANVEGLEWMGDLLARDDVDWQAVQEVHDQWSKSDGGLGPGGMLIISIIASAVTAGAASSLALAATGLEVATVNGTTTLVMAGTNTVASSMHMALYTAISAGVTSLSAQLATSLGDAAAGGDLGKNLTGIASIDGLRSLAATMIMAGTISTYESDFAGMGAPGEVLAKTAVKTLTNTIIGGDDLEQSFRTALGSTLANHVTSAFKSYAKGEITSKELNRAVNIIISGAAGAAGSSIAGGDSMQGALSAIVAELAEQIKAPELTESQKTEARQNAQMVLGCVECEGGNERVNLRAAGIAPEKMVDVKTGLDTILYVNTVTGAYTLAYSGTNESKDWDTNFDQEFGEVGSQYAQVRDQLTYLRTILGDDAIINVTGESLGGGLATAALSTGLVNKAVVFNPAGVHATTMEYLNPGDSAAAIDRANAAVAYVSRADVLTNIQDLLDFMLPKAVGTRVVVEGGGSHLLSDMIEAFY